MANEFVIEGSVNTPRLLNDNSEKQLKVLLSIYPSDEVRIKASNNVQSRVGADVCIVLDVSSSMREEVSRGVTRLDASISAIKKLVPLLREEDTISLVAYEADSYVIFKGLKRRDEQQIVEQVEECHRYRGTTNISGGLREARLLLNQFSSERPKRIIFLTDGHPVGDTEENGEGEGELLADYNITVDSLGIGQGFNYDFIQRITEPSRGRTSMIDNAEEAEKIFRQLFKSTQDVLATNAELRFSFSPQVRVTDHYRGTPENMYLGKVPMGKTDRSYTVTLGQLEANQRYDYYFSITVPAQIGYTGTFRLFKSELTYRIPSFSIGTEKTAKSVMVEFVDKPEHAKRRSSNLERGYTLVEIMKLLRELEKFEKSDDKINTINRYEKIIHKYKGLGLSEEVEIYERLLREYKSSGKVTLQELNIAREKSSTSGADSGELPPTIDDDDIF